MSMNNASNIIAWFNMKILESEPVSLSLLHTAIVHSVLGNDHSIAVTHSPMTRKKSEKSVEIDQNVTASVLLRLISFTIPFITTFFVMFYIKERATKSKLLQLVSGLNVTTFWLTSFLFDFINFIFIIATPIILYIAYQKDLSFTINEVMALIVLVVTFGIAVLPTLFVTSFVFKGPTMGLVWTIVLSAFPSKTIIFQCFHLCNLKMNFFGFVQRPSSI